VVFDALCVGFGHGGQHLTSSCHDSSRS
jgi:hypothetical protein